MTVAQELTTVSHRSKSVTDEVEELSWTHTHLGTEQCKILAGVSTRKEWNRAKKAGMHHMDTFTKIHLRGEGSMVEFIEASMPFRHGS